MYNIEELLRKIAHLIEGYLYPHRHGEFRPVVDYWVGLIPIVIGILLVLPALSEGWPWVGWMIILGIIAFGIFLCSLYFRVQLHFRRYGVFIFRYGKLKGYETYSDWARMRLSHRFLPPVEVLRKDGSILFMPWVGDRSGQISEMLWRVSEAGVPIPDQIERMNRLGSNEIEPFAISVRGKFPGRE